MKKSSAKFVELVDMLSSLPTIGKKSAFKIAYHLLFEDGFRAIKLAHLIEEALSEVQKCVVCGNITEDEICHICADDARATQKGCVWWLAQKIFLP